MLRQSELGPGVLRRLLRQNEPAYVFAVGSARMIDIAALARASGHQALYVDMKHGALSPETAAQICQAALAQGMTPLVLVSVRDSDAMGRMLENGALGVIASDVRSAADATAELCQVYFIAPTHALENVSFPPFGGLDPITWSGELSPVEKPGKKKGKKHEAGEQPSESASAQGTASGTPSGAPSDEAS